MDTEYALKQVIAIRRRLNARDVVSTADRNAAIKLLDDLIPLLSHRAAPEVVAQPADPHRGVQYGIVQYPGDKMLWGPSTDPIAVLKAMGRFDPDACRVVERPHEKAPWTPIA